MTDMLAVTLSTELWIGGFAEGIGCYCAWFLLHQNRFTFLYFCKFS